MPRIKRPFLWLGIAVVLAAGAPLTSPRPVPRPTTSAPAIPPQHPSVRAQEAGLGVVLQNIFRPKPRQGTAAQHPGYDPRLAVGISPRPSLRPGNFARIAAAQPARSTTGSARGSICGNRQIQGRALAAIPAKLPGCGLSNPVSVTSVSGVRLSTAATLSCETAKALNTWVRRGVMPAVGNRGGGLASLKVIAHYSCRTRNNQPGAKISEHGRGKAVDIAGIYLNNGDYISVLEGWRSRRDARLLKAMHRSACGIFGTVLGPDANRFHQDHLHVDTARYRSGSYCK